MGKLLIALSFLALMILLIGTALAPNNPTFWLASGSNSYQIIRALLAVLLFVQITTNPPRNIWFRILAGGLSLIIGSWAIRQTYDYHMECLDTLAFMGASLTIFVTALERKATDLLVKPLSPHKQRLLKAWYDRQVYQRVV